MSPEKQELVRALTELVVVLTLVLRTLYLERSLSSARRKLRASSYPPPEASTRPDTPRAIAAAGVVRAARIRRSQVEAGKIACSGCDARNEVLYPRRCAGGNGDTQAAVWCMYCRRCLDEIEAT